MLFCEVLPDEAADRLDPVRAKRRKLIELVEVVAEDHLDPLALDPLAVGLKRHVGLARLGHAWLVPDWVRNALGHAGARPRALAREDERLVSQLVERRADVARDDRLAGREPFGDDADPHQNTHQRVLLSHQKVFIKKIGS